MLPPPGTPGGVVTPFLIPDGDDDLDFPGGAMVKNPPSRAGDMGSLAGLIRFHMPGATEPLYSSY